MVLFIGLCYASWAQTSVISGSLKDGANGQILPAVSLIVKGTNNGTFTNDRGVFTLAVVNFPTTLIVSSIGFETVELLVNASSDKIDLRLIPSAKQGDEVVVSATKACASNHRTDGYYNRRFMASYNTIPAATETLKESNSPAIGIEKSASAALTR